MKEDGKNEHYSKEGDRAMKAILQSIRPEWVAKILNGEKTISGEQWKYIEGHENEYLVSNFGRIASIPRKRTKGGLLKPQIGKWGYEHVCIREKGKYKLHKVHRLVAKAFLPNPKNFPQVNHINGIKTDNRVENLEWCSAKHNSKEAHRLGLQNPSDKQKEIARKICLEQKSIKVIAIKSGYSEVFDSISEAGRQLNISPSCISRVIKGLRCQANGYRFERG